MLVDSTIVMLENISRHQQQSKQKDDNPALNEAARGSALLCVYVLQEPRPWCNISGVGEHRRRFLLESLRDLQEAQDALIVAQNNVTTSMEDHLEVQLGLPTDLAYR